MDNILTVSNLEKSFHTNEGEIKALDSVTFNVKEKEFISIVGPSGCGKSTILSILSSLEEKSSGEIKIPDNYTIGYMLQNDSLFEWRTVLENCLLGLEIENKNTKENKDYVIHLLKTYGLEEFINEYPSRLSGGMRQRVALIRTLATKPDILLLDEALSALDYQSRLAISDDIFRIIKQEGKTAVMVTHDIAEAISMSDRIVVLSKRPAVVKKIYNIELTNKSTPINNRKCKEFSKYYDLIWRDLDVHI